jgi:hypothetical protein
MYKEVHKEMVACGIASKVDRKFHVDKRKLMAMASPHNT